MLNREKHNLIMGQIIKDFYSNNLLAPLLGFKGGTCACYFYGLPRFSVDLDFDLLKTDESTQKKVYAEVEKILLKYGVVKDKTIKFFTIWFLLSYGDAEHNIKIEINTRRPETNIEEYYDFKELLGTPVLIARPEYMFANKLVALTDRKKMVMRDIFDIHYFASKNWEIEKEIVELRSGKKFVEHLQDCILAIENIGSNEILAGIGELINDEQKRWVKKSLISETVFLLKNYIQAMG